VPPTSEEVWTDFTGLRGGLFATGARDFICDGESEGEMDGTLDRARKERGTRGDEAPSKSISAVEFITGFLPVPRDLEDRGERGLSASPDLLSASLLGALGDWRELNMKQR
jgi:hypothetical protein